MIDPLDYRERCSLATARAAETLDTLPRVVLADHVAVLQRVLNERVDVEALGDRQAWLLFDALSGFLHLFSLTGQAKPAWLDLASADLDRLEARARRAPLDLSEPEVSFDDTTLMDAPVKDPCNDTTAWGEPHGRAP